ncbi:MAG TPA: hypothetical protein VEK11_10575 [Thermoanaerobaculia bacterium]|nr:hypothetical protein [Thermoanaerobaculia bacterium]
MTATKQIAGAPVIDSASVPFPKVATNQKRPVDPIDDGGYTQGACNCKRKCADNGYQCSFTGSTDNICRIKTDGKCETCTRTDCGA